MMTIYFKNHGVAAGTSLEHPHFQMISLPVVPHQIRQRLADAMTYFDETGTCVYCDMVRQDRRLPTDAFRPAIWVYSRNYLHSPQDVDHWLKESGLGTQDLKGLCRALSSNVLDIEREFDRLWSVKPSDRKGKVRIDEYFIPRGPETNFAGR